MVEDLDDAEVADYNSNTTSPLPKIPDSLMTCLHESFSQTPKSICLLPSLTMKGNNIWQHPIMPETAQS